MKQEWTNPTTMKMMEKTEAKGKHSSLPVTIEE